MKFVSKECLETEIKIRLNSFETNSSSQHSLVVSGETDSISESDIKMYNRELLAKIKKSSPDDIDEDGSFYINYYSIISHYDKYFGREFSILNKWHEKLAYVLSTYLVDLDIILDIMYEIFPKFKGFKIYKDIYYDDDPILHSDELSFEEIFNTCSDGECILSGFRTALNISDPKISEKDIIKELIFNRKYIILTGSDEDPLLEKFLTSGLLGMDKILLVLKTEYDSKTDRYIGRFVSTKKHINDSFNRALSYFTEDND